MMKLRISCFAIWICAGLFSGYGSSRIDSQQEAITIQEAVQMALAHSPEALLAKAQSLRAQEALRETRSSNLPQVVIGSGLAYNNGFPLSIEGSAPSIFEVVASQPIFSKTNKNLAREAEETGKASILGIDSARNEIASETARAYYELHQARKSIAVVSARVDSARKQQAQVESLLVAGRVRPVDAKMTNVARLNLEHQLSIAQEQEKVAETLLLELTGISDKASFRTVEPQIENPIFSMREENLYQQTLESTPEILQAEAAVRAKELHIEAVKGESLPKMEIISHYALFSRTNNYQDYFNRFTRNNFIVGLSVQFPVFNGFQTSSRVAQSRHEAAEANYRLQNMKSSLKLNIQRELSALRIAQSAVELAHSEVDAARENLQVNDVLLESGRISAQELESLRSTLQQKELAQIESDQALFQRKLSLLRVAGIIASALQ
jgi:outer membrane protein